MRQIKYILIDDSGLKNREHHYSISNKGCITESTDIRKAVKVIDRQVDPDGYNANSVVVRLVSGLTLFILFNSKVLSHRIVFFYGVRGLWLAAFGTRFKV